MLGGGITFVILFKHLHHGPCQDPGFGSKPGLQYLLTKL